MSLRAGLIAVLALPACYMGSASSFSPKVLQRGRNWVAARGVEVVRQRARNDCGAAALAMVLGYWNVPVRLADVSRAYPRPPVRGIRAEQLRDFARTRGLEAFLFRGRLQDLWQELLRKRPVVVGLVKPFLVRSLAHYEVVVAINREERRVVTLDPARGWRQNSFRGFLREWVPAGRVTLVVFASRASRNTTEP